jgi:XTP/dITP diphosphohydrolase
VAGIAASFGVQLKRLERGKFELQSDSLMEIASFAAKDACQSTLRSVVAEDSGFFVDALGGFPGPYSSYVYRTIGNSGILKLLGATDSRKASFQAAVAFCKPRARLVCFVGTVYGTVTRNPRGIHGFGFDPIFAPTNGARRTFAEMPRDEKNQYSHRARAFAKFFRWLTRSASESWPRQVK